MGRSSGGSAASGTDVTTAIADAIATHTALDIAHVPAGYKVAAMKTPSGAKRIEVVHESDVITGTTSGDIFYRTADGTSI